MSYIPRTPRCLPPYHTILYTIPYLVPPAVSPGGVRSALVAAIRGVEAPHAARAAQGAACIDQDSI